MPASTQNEVSAGVVIGPVVMGRDISVVLPAVVPSALNGLRPKAAEFVGRAAMLDELLELLDPGGTETEIARISGVAGLAGVGKTELALQTAHLAVARGWFPGGVLMVDMQGYEVESKRLTPGQALGGLLRALSVPENHVPSDVQDRERLYRAILGEYATQNRAILVVIDNASSSGQVMPLLPGAGRAIVTSRHTLADLHGRLIDVAVLSLDAGVELLARLLWLKRGKADTRVADNPDEARRLVEFCAGLPLAVEIIAALLAVFPAKPLSELAAELAAENTRLGALRYEQLAVQATLEMSYRHLSPAQARLFRLLSVNPGPEVATAAVAAMAELEEQAVRPLLEELARAHLIEPGSRYGRWRMHDLVRLYAKERGEAHANDDGRLPTLARLLEYYLITSWKASSHLNSTVANPSEHGFDNLQDGLVWLDAELPNLIAASHTAVDLAPEAGIIMARSLGRYLSRRGDTQNWVDLATLAVRTARRIGDREQEGKSLGDLGAALQSARRFDDAIVTCQEAVELCDTTGDRRGAGMALGSMANALKELRRFDEAIAACDSAAAAFRDTGDRREEGLTHSTLAGILLAVGRRDEAIAARRRAAAILHEAGDSINEGATLSGLGRALVHAGQHEQASIVCRRAVAIFQAAGDEAGEAEALTALGYALQELRDYESAIAVGRQAVAIHRNARRRHDEAAALVGLARAFTRSDRPGDAVVACQDAAEVYRETGDRHGEGYALMILGVALHNTDRFEQAAIASREAIDIARESHDRGNEAAALTNLGLTLIEIGELKEAAMVCLAAISIYREIDEPEGATSARLNLGLALREAFTR